MTPHKNDPDAAWTALQNDCISARITQYLRALKVQKRPKLNSKNDHSMVLHSLTWPRNFPLLKVIVDLWPARGSILDLLIFSREKS